MAKEAQETYEEIEERLLRLEKDECPSYRNMLFITTVNAYHYVCTNFWFHFPDGLRAFLVHQIGGSCQPVDLKENEFPIGIKCVNCEVRGVVYVTDKELVVSKRELTSKDGYYPTQYHSISKDFPRRVRFDCYSRVTIPNTKHMCKATSMANGMTILIKSKVYNRTELPITVDNEVKCLLSCPVLRRIGTE